MIEGMDIGEWEELQKRMGFKPKNKSPENKVKAVCRAWLRSHRIIHNRQQSGMIKAVNPKGGFYYVHLADEGSGDLVGCTRKGRYFEIETKPKKGGKWEKSQQDRKIEVEASGGIYILARSSDDLEARKNEFLS